MIVVAGEALVDLIVRGPRSIEAVPGGGPYNAARAIARLGWPTTWIGGLSSDRFGRELEAGLAADGISLDHVQRSDLPTTLALAELDPGGSATYRFYSEGTSAPAVLPDPLRGAIGRSTRAVYVGSLGLVLEPMASTLEGLVEALPDDVLLLVDPNCRPSITPDAGAYRGRIARVLARADIVKASGDDLAFLRPGEDALEAAAWIRSLGPRAVLVTDGDRAVRVVAAGETTGVEVPPVRVLDTVGAGDTFGGAVLACLVHDGIRRPTLDHDAAVAATRFGVRAASMACTRAGADPPTLAELGGWPAR